MVQYKCKHCNKTFNKKSVFITHINRKIKCIDRQYTLNCIHCNKSFTTKSSVTRHMKKYCNVILNNEKNNDLVKRLYKLEEENKELKDKTNKLEQKIIKDEEKTNNITLHINNNINNNINININLNPYGKEDMSKIDEIYIKKAIDRIFYSPLELVKQIHFNDKYPENHNIFIPNMKEDYVKIYKGNNKWDRVPKKDCIDNLYINKRLFIEGRMDEIMNDVTIYKKERFEKFIKSDYNDKTAKEIKKYISCLLNNEKRKAIKMQNKLKQIKK